MRTGRPLISRTFGCALVILDVAAAEGAARVHVFEAGENIGHLPPHGMGYHVEASAMAHGHHALVGAVLDGRLQGFLKQRNQRGLAFERETLGADVKRLQHLLEDVGLDQLRQDALAIDRLGFGFHALAHPVAPLGVGHVHELGADGAAINAPRLIDRRTAETQLRRFLADVMFKGIELRLHVTPAAKGVENFLTFSLVRLRRNGLGGRHDGSLQ